MILLRITTTLRDDRQPSEPLSKRAIARKDGDHSHMSEPSEYFGAPGAEVNPPGDNLARSEGRAAKTSTYGFLSPDDTIKAQNRLGSGFELPQYRPQQDGRKLVSRSPLGLRMEGQWALTVRVPRNYNPTVDVRRRLIFS